MKKFCFTLGASILLLACTKSHDSMNHDGMDGSSSSSSNKMHDVGGRPLTAMMTGAQEVPVMGDPDGTGMAKIWLNQGQGVIMYELSVSNIEPAAAAHIHRGAAGVAGPVVVNLAPPTNGMSSGTVQASKELIKDIRQHPENYYINVHNQPYPGGAVRGQLMK